MTFMYAVTSAHITDTAVVFTPSVGREARERALRVCVENGGMPVDSQMSVPFFVTVRDIEQVGLRYYEPYVNR